MVETKDFTIKYLDYKKFVNFISDNYKIVLSNINPLLFFHPKNTSAKIRLKSEDFFNKKLVEIPFFNVNDKEFNKHNRFEEFTSRNEVNNLSLWALSFLKFLSHDKVRLGKELEIIQSNNPRDGRLDVVAMDGKEIIIFEVKTTLFSLLTEKRFKIQIPEYYKEAIKIIKGESNLSIFLLVGGEETDLYPPSDPNCTTGKIGNISQIFYDSLIKYKIKFISANALWNLFANSIINNKKYYWNEILPKIFSDNKTLGLLSAGKVIYKEGTISIEKLDI